MDISPESLAQDVGDFHRYVNTKVHTEFLARGGDPEWLRHVGNYDSLMVYGCDCRVCSNKPNLEGILNP